MLHNGGAFVRYVDLGKTGLRVSEVGFGGIPIIRLQTEAAVSVLRHAYDRGITFFDTANAYRDSEQKIGIALHDVRDKIVIATKSMARDAAGVITHLENSLRQLQTDYVDIFQLHQVAQPQDWESIIAPGGVLEVLSRAKEQGKIHHIGITSHSLPMALQMIESGFFTTLQFPFSFIEDAAKEKLHPRAQELGLGIIAMKPFAGGVIDNAAVTFKYLRQYPNVIPIPGFDSIASVDQVVGLYEQDNEVHAADLQRMEQYRSELGPRFCRRCEYCQPCPNGVRITPAMAYPVIAGRMSPAVAVGFSAQAMETIPHCVECGVCTERCPYELPIPELLKQYYQLYEEHRQQAKPKGK